MQTDQERSCASYGATNPRGAGFCWQCYAPFADAAASAASASVGRGIPAMPPAPQAGAPITTPAPTTGSRSRVVRIVVGVVAALVVGGVVRSMLTPTYHVPDSIAGEARLHDATSVRFEQTMTQTGQQDDVKLESAVYGTGDSPDLFFVLANGRAEEDADQLFSEF